MLDELIEQHYVRHDPQFEDPDAYDEDAWLEKMREASENVDDAIRALEAANQEHEIPGGEKIIRLLMEASRKLEDAS